MNRKIFVGLIILIFLFLLIYFFLLNNQPNDKNSNTENGDEIISKEDIKIKIEIGDYLFFATLENNKTTEELIKLFPMTIDMKDHLSNEKFYDLPNSLTQKNYKPSKINVGDIMLFGSNTIVIFYDNFSTSYTYTKIGKIDDTTSLKTALGSTNIIVKFELVK